MHDALIAQQIVTAIKAGLTVLGLTAEVAQNYQPRSQGGPTGPIIFFHHMINVPVGWPAKKQVWNATNLNYDVSEIQNVESHWQFGAMASQSPSQDSAFTAADWCFTARTILQIDTTIAALSNVKIGVQRVSTVQSTWFTNDSGQNLESPSFDAIFSHQDPIATTVQGVKTITATVKKVY